MRAWRILRPICIHLWVGLKAIFLMATGMCILAGGFIAFPLILDFVEKSRASWQPASDFPFFLFNWSAPIIWGGVPFLMFFVFLAWSIFFMFLGVAVLKEEKGG